jgi:hypothetical protein
MIIGQNSNNELYQVLLTVAQLVDDQVDTRLSINELREHCSVDDDELKHILGFLTRREWIRADRIGGDFLYDEISLTSSGKDKARDILRKNQ